jgi:hypothetical protein
MRIIFCRGAKCKQDCAEPAQKDSEPEIPSTSPARLLAASLTDPDTRGEWERKYNPGVALGYGYVEYRNAARDLSVTKHYLGRSDRVHTPFTLTIGEQKIVLAALDQFEKWEAAKRVADALSRLTAPKGKRK